MDYVVAVVADITEIPCKTIMSKCSRADVVDARWIAVYLLHKAGVYTMRIAEHLGITPRYVQYIVTDYEDRINLNQPMHQYYDAVRKRLGEQLGFSYYSHSPKSNVNCSSGRG